MRVDLPTGLSNGEAALKRRLTVDGSEAARRDRRAPRAAAR